MSKSYSGLFRETNSKFSDKNNPINKIDYNKAGSLDIKEVNKINKVSDHGSPIESHPNSVNQKYNRNGVLLSERYYNNKGLAYIDIDYTDHGNPKMHPDVPHQHKITITKNGFHREKGRKIRK